MRKSISALAIVALSVCFSLMSVSLSAQSLEEKYLQDVAEIIKLSCPIQENENTTIVGADYLDNCFTLYCTLNQSKYADSIMDLSEEDLKALYAESIGAIAASNDVMLMLYENIYKAKGSVKHVFDHDGKKRILTMQYYDYVLPSDGLSYEDAIVYLENLAKDTNALCPYVIDAYTTMESAVFNQEEGHSLYYRYTLTHGETTDLVMKMQSPSLKVVMLNKYKTAAATDESVRDMINCLKKTETTFAIEYTLDDDKLLVFINPEDW